MSNALFKEGQQVWLVRNFNASFETDTVRETAIILLVLSKGATGTILWITEKDVVVEFSLIEITRMGTVSNERGRSLAESGVHIPAAYLSVSAIQRAPSNLKEQIDETINMGIGAQINVTTFPAGGKLNPGAIPDKTERSVRLYALFTKASLALKKYMVSALADEYSSDAYSLLVWWIDEPLRTQVGGRKHAEELRAWWRGQPVSGQEFMGRGKIVEAKPPQPPTQPPTPELNEDYVLDLYAKAKAIQDPVEREKAMVQVRQLSKKLTGSRLYVAVRKLVYFRSEIQGALK